MTDESNSRGLSRRGFLYLTAGAGSGLALGLYTGTASAQPRPDDQDGAKVMAAKNIDHLIVSDQGWSYPDQYVDVTVQTDRLPDSDPAPGLLFDFTRDPDDQRREWLGYQTSLLKTYPADDWSSYDRMTFQALPIGVRKPSFSKVGFPWQDAVTAHLEPDTWNTVVWDFGHLDPAQAASMSQMYFAHLNIGHFTDEPGRQKFYVARFRLQQVSQPQFEGWTPDPAEVVMAHAGFAVTGEKVALVDHDLVGERFEVRDAGGLVLAGAVAHGSGGPGSMASSTSALCRSRARTNCTSPG